MKPRKHWGFRIAIGLVITIATLMFLGGVFSLVLSIQYGFEDAVAESLLLMIGSGFGGLIAYLLMSSLYRWWQKNDLETRRTMRKQELRKPHSRTQQHAKQRSSRIKSLRDKQ